MTKKQAREDSSSDNRSLTAAKVAKEDEFYTQLTDIEKEMRHYRSHFAGKTVLCNCDDPFESNFFRYFVLNFNRLQLKKLIATCYRGSTISHQELNLFPDEPKRPTKTPYKAIVTTVYDKTGDGSVDLDDVRVLFESGENQLVPLKKDGDFRSEECLALLDEADIVVTNPPFSLFREYISTLMEHGNGFIVLGNQNAITYKEIFPLIMKNKIWLGNKSGDMAFAVPDYFEPRKTRYWQDDAGQKWRSMGNICWFTNLDIRKRHEVFELTKKYTPEAYPTYDNYNAIEVSKAVDIPRDYEGTMGVPVTFLANYNPEQFEIVGISKTWFGGASKVYPQQLQISKDGAVVAVTKLNDGPVLKLATAPAGKTYYTVNGEPYIQLYARVLIRNKNPEV